MGKAPATTNKSAPTPAAYLKHRRRRRVLITSLLMSFLLICTYADYNGFLLYDGDDLDQYDGRHFRIVRVIDGDTLVINQQGVNKTQTSVRLWGIDTPELAKFGSNKEAEPFAEQARDFTHSLVGGRIVRLLLEGHRQRDKYGRLLAYVELDDGRLLNELLLVNGLARWEPRFSHRYLDRFYKAQHDARGRKMGIWSD